MAMPRTEAQQLPPLIDAEGLTAWIKQAAREAALEVLANVGRLPADERLTYTDRECAALLGLQPWNVRDLRRAGKLRFIHAGRTPLVPREALQEFIAGRGPES